MIEKPDRSMMTQRELLDSILPYLWEWAQDADPDGALTDLALALQTMKTVRGCCANWDPEQASFEGYVQASLRNAVNSAIRSENTETIPERNLAALLAAAEGR